MIRTKSEVAVFSFKGWKQRSREDLYDNCTKYGGEEPFAKMLCVLL